MCNYSVKLFFIVFLLILVQEASSQGNSYIEGVVTDSLSKETLIGASIEVVGQNLFTTSDYDGYFRINSVKPGTWKLQIRYLGYRSKMLDVTVNPGAEQKINVAMTYESVLSDEVVVTAQAEGQIASINQQLADNTIKNIVSAKKIQETPNANAAEAIGRISGVSIVRSGGEGSKVVVRGLAPKFNKVQVEGVRMAATGGDDRSSNLSMISPYMLEGIEVSKAAMANQEGDVIGGTVNFILREAPDKPTFDLLLQGGYSSLNRNFRNGKLVIGGSRRFLARKLGVFAQIDIEKRDRSSNELSVNYLNRTNQVDDFPISLGAMSVQDVKRDIRRNGATIVLDYKIPNGTIKMSNFASLINVNQENKYELYNPFFSTHSYGMNIGTNNILIVTNALKYKQSFGAYTINGGISYSQSSNEQPRTIDFFATEPNAFEQGTAFVTAPDSIQFYSRNAVDKANVQRISKNQIVTSENEWSADLNLSKDINFSDNVKLKLETGIRYKVLTKNFAKESHTIPVAQSGQGGAFVNASIASFDWLNNSLAPDASKLPYSLFVDEDYGTNTFPTGKYHIQNTADRDKLEQFAELAEDFFFKDFILSLKDNYQGSEEYMAGYVMPIFKIGSKITFIPGLRYEQLSTSYTAKRGDNTFQEWDQGYFHQDTTVSRINGNLLPMFHLKYKPLEWFDIRLAYTHTLARPDYSQIIPKWDIGINSISFNNPFLVPSLSRNYDIYLSAYKSKLGLLTVGGFHKSIENLIYNAGTTVVREEDIVEHSLPENSEGVAISKIVNNANPANLLGLEIEWQTRFWYMQNFLRGLVLTANYTRTFSSVDYERTELVQKFLQEPPFVTFIEENTPYNERLGFQPTDIFNLQLGYDYKGLSTRISFLYQNDIFSNPNFFRLLRGATDDYFRIDYSMNQKLPWKGTELFLNFSNLTSSSERDILISSASPTRVQYYGFTLDLGFRYRIK